MKINGMIDTKCHYENILVTKAPDLNKLFPNGIPTGLDQFEPKDQTTRFDCKLSTAEINEYNQALEKSVIKNGEGFNFEIDNLNSAHEILNNFTNSGSCVPQIDGLFDHNP